MKKLILIAFISIFSLNSFGGPGGGGGGPRVTLEARLIDGDILQISDGLDVLEVYENELQDIEFEIEDHNYIDGKNLRDLIMKIDRPIKVEKMIIK